MGGTPQHNKLLTYLLVITCLLLAAACRPSEPRPHPVDALIAEATTHANNGEFTAAEAAYRRALEIVDDERAADLGYRLAKLYLRWNRPADGLTVLATTPTGTAKATPQRRQLRMALLAADEQRQEARAAAQELLIEAPANTAAWQVLIEAHMALGECGAAQEAASRALAVTEDLPPHLLESTHLLHGNYDALAQAAPTLAAGIVPCAANCDIAMGLRLVRQQRWAIAACVLTRGLAAGSPPADASRDGEAHAWLGEAWMQAGRVNAARSELRQAVDLAPNSPLAWLLLGKSALIWGEFETAQDALYTAHQLDPLSPAPCLALAELYAAQGRYNEADPWIEAALERAPTEPDIWVAAARFYLTRDIATDITADIVEQALALAPEDPDVLVIQGWHQLQAGDYQAALRALDQAVERAPQLAEAHYLRGIILQATGDSEEAAAALTHAADLGDHRAQR